MIKRRRYQSKKKFLEAQKRFRLRCIIFGILAVLLLVGFIFLMRIESMQINSVVVSETAFVDSADLQKKVVDELAGNYVLVIPKTNTVLYPKEKIVTTIAAGNPSFAEVSVSRNGLQELEVTIREHQPYGTFCTTDINAGAQDEDMLVPSTSASGTRVLAGAASVISRTRSLGEITAETTNCYLFNEDSFVYATTTIDVAHSELVFFTDPLSASPRDLIGTTFYPKEQIDTVRAFSEKIATLQLRVDSAWTKKGEVFTVQTTDNLKIHIEPTDNPDNLFANLKTLLENNVITEGYYKTIDYIDLRFGNRVFYREVEG